MTSHWLAHGHSYQQLAVIYSIGKSTAVSVVHATMDYFLEVFIPTQIVFPRGRDLDQVMVDFEFLGGLPYGSGVIDGTFMKIDNLIQHGD